MDGLKRADVLIGGAGITGLSLAIALRQGLGDGFAIAVADPALARPGEDPRASAIVAAARRLFETIGVWDKVADNAQPILDMAISDSRLNDAVRPVFLTFDGDVEPGEPFAHMVDNGSLLVALKEKAAESGIELWPMAVANFDDSGAAMNVRLDLSAGHSHTRGSPAPMAPATPGSPPSWEQAQEMAVVTRLLVAADGARSGIRERAGIATHGWRYGQSAIVTTVAHERDHHGRAEEHFLPAGPFAILPLKGNRSSIVWTEDAREAERIVALPDAEFHAELERRFGLKLGDIRAVSARRAFPVEFFVARSFIAERLALVGDAAHVIHPIAGQGLNMGLKDVAALAEVITDAARLGLDPGSSATLDRYQRWRRFDTMAMGVATDGLNRLFSNRSDILRLARDVGLGLVERLPVLKDAFIREAAGLTGEVPKLLRGEVL